MNSISTIEEYFCNSLPETYKRFLKNHSSEYQNEIVILYLVEDVVERNETYNVKEYAHGYITVGDDSGGSAFMLKLGKNDSPVYIVGHGSMDPEDMEKVSNSFSEWLNEKCIL